MSKIIITNEEKESKVRVIPARKKFIPVALQENKKLRVAAYCRVSTQSDEQELSFDSQCTFYKDMITKNPNYIFVDIYADEGITGTSVKKRKAFQRLMKDALAGKIDLIITKSVTRFARNTLDAVGWMRKLKDKGVDIYFETDNIHSLTTSEMDFTMLSAFAQESSNNKSISIKWGYQRQFEKGKVYFTNMFGFRKVEGEVVIHEQEAKIFRKMSEMYLDGESMTTIKDYLITKKIKTRMGKLNWSVTSITRMFKNEKYCGDGISGKTYNEDFLHQKRLENTGQRKRYYIQNSHPGIISRETYQALQTEMARRQSKKIIDIKDVQPKSTGKKANKKSSGKFSSVNALANHIICADCGAFYRRAVWTKRDGTKDPVWRCSNKLDNGYNACPESMTIKEKKLFDELNKLVRSKMRGKGRLHDELSKKLAEYVNPKDILDKKELIGQRLKEADQKLDELIKDDVILVSRGVQDENQLKEHLERYNGIKRTLSQELVDLENKLFHIRSSKENKILKTLNQMDISNMYLSQEELAIFIENIIVRKTYVEVETKIGSVHKIDLNKLQ